MTPHPVFIAQLWSAKFRPDFVAYLQANLHVYDAFEREALKVAARGRKHYSARTIVEVLRHNSAIAEVDGTWKLNDHFTPGLSRLFALMHPEHAALFEYRASPASQREEVSA